MTGRVWVGAVLRLVMTIGAVLGVGMPAPAIAAPVPRMALASPAPTASAASIGVLSNGSALGSHGCSAAVVASPTEDVVATAAHCVSGTGIGLVFAPGYGDGTAPYGTWDVQAAYVDPGWLSDHDPHDDVAFLVVVPSVANPRPAAVQAVVGGFVLGSAAVAGSTVRVSGYVAHSDEPVACSASVYVTDDYPSIDCAGFASGTSGGPWVETDAGGTAYLTGVIGGLNQGGCTASTSYSSPFTAATAAVLARAVDDAAGDSVPAAGDDGC